jgi:hypothetical protein
MIAQEQENTIGVADACHAQISSDGPQMRRERKRAPPGRGSARFSECCLLLADYAKAASISR